MTHRHTVAREFQRRVEAIPEHGLGLSVDVYVPDLFDLVDALAARRLEVGYYEVFKATDGALASVRNRLADVRLTYHGEGLWLTQPEAPRHLFAAELKKAAGQVSRLRSSWLNHECATKEIAGYAFGTYLPPVYTEAVARVTAQGALEVQRRLDAAAAANASAPLFLLEIPPLSYFVAGTIPIPTFFRLVTDMAPCGLVLDIGHLWTVYRYAGAWKARPLVSFLREFLEQFPLERVVEIHVAGLAVHETDLGSDEPGTPPFWIDSHAAPIPPVLFEMLEHVMNDERLVNLRGIALEVDTKPIPLIVDEFEAFRARFAPLMARTRRFATRAEAMVSAGKDSPAYPPLPVDLRQQLQEDNRQYARIVAGQESAGPIGWWSQDGIEGVERYRRRYLPHEILHWGGSLSDMFPETCRELATTGPPLSEFVSFWCRESRPVTQPYDFFLLKIHRFLEFIAESTPSLVPVAQEEAQTLREAYAAANEPAEVGR